MVLLLDFVSLALGHGHCDDANLACGSFCIHAGGGYHQLSSSAGDETGQYQLFQAGSQGDASAVASRVLQIANGNGAGGECLGDDQLQAQHGGALLQGQGIESAVAEVGRYP
jgi:hypothetical protein